VSQPNIIIVFADDLGYGDLGCYGSDRNRTPRLDRMAREGVRLTDFYSASPVCSPSRAALMTGCYPRRVGLDTGYADRGVLFPGDPIGLHPDEQTIAAVLAGAGYRTGLVGKWHLGDQKAFLPSRHGFDFYFGLPYSNDMQPMHVKNAQHHFPPLPLLRGDEICEVDPNQVNLTDRYLAESLRFIRESADEKRPFFLCLSHMYVHLPLYVPQRFLGLSQGEPYRAAVEHLDATTGVLLDELDRLGIGEQTVVIFTSDNGSNGKNGGTNRPLRGFKGQTWEGGMRMPCLVRWPGTIPGGKTLGVVATMMDIMPTLASFAGAAAPLDRQIDGFDISDHLVAPDQAESPHESFAYYTPHGELAAVRAGRWKLHLAIDELYDLEDDMGESRNRYPQRPGIVAELGRIAERYRRELGDERTGTTGAGCRAVGRVENPLPMTDVSRYDPAVRALYDMDEQ
jgi:arylsulfatase A-like enzyme